MEEWRQFSEHFFIFAGRKARWVSAEENENQRESHEKESGVEAEIRVGGVALGSLRVATEEGDEEKGEAWRASARYFLEKAAERLEAELFRFWKDAKSGGCAGKAQVLIHREALGKDLRLKEIARQCGMSEGHLSRLFHAETGMTFSAYVARFRAEHARSLLCDKGKTITEIAFESGFQSISQFQRVFRAVFGTSPGQMRKEKTAGTPGPKTEKIS